MAEAGGASTQAGIYYQNSVAALVLLNLLDQEPVPPRERVVEVRLEAPTDVDDVVVTYADGHREFQNVKMDVSPSGPVWDRLWQCLKVQFDASDFGAEDQLTIVLSEMTPLARTLRDICERASTAPDANEWHSRLKNDHQALLTRIEASLSSPGDALELLRRIAVSVKSEDQIQDEFNRRRLGGKFSLSATMLTTLRDIAGGGARKRASHTAAATRRRLMQEYGIEVAEPYEWGLSAYRAVVARLARIQIPGTAISGSAEELFVWPRARPYERSKQSDFEDEQTIGEMDEDACILDMKAFPSDHLDRCIVVAGPGHGKSVLLVSIAGLLARGPMVPVLIPLASLAASGVGVAEFLVQQINREFDVKPDWQRLAEQGLLVLLFDGLDEVPVGIRPGLLHRISTFSARYHKVPWMLTVRDPSVVVGSFEALFVELLPLNDQDVLRFIETMKRRLSTVDVYEFVRRLNQYPDLRQLARIPLFLSILLATIDDLRADLPATRSDVIEAYLKTIFFPQAHKPIASPNDQAQPLRKIAEVLAFERLERQEVGASEREVHEVIARHIESTSESALLFELLQSNGILRKQSGIRLQFPFPIVQEYLAACHLLQNFPESLGSRIEDAIQRPWAQVIQFAIEQHPNPTPIVRAILARPDDAFCTGLRLVGRCITNGAQVAPPIRQEVGDRLVDFWIGSSWSARERVGRIIVDGFSKPMSDALRAAVYYRHLMNSGAGEIISNARDRALTLSVVKHLIHSQSDQFSLYHSLKAAISEAGDEAFTLILEGLRQCELGTDRYEGIANLASHFEQGSVSRAIAIDAANDATLPKSFRVQAFYIAGVPLDFNALAVVQEVLADEEAKGTWNAIRILGCFPDCCTEFIRLLRNEEITLKRRREIAGYLTSVFPDELARSRFINEVLVANGISPEILDIVCVFAARHGDKRIFQSLVERIPDAPLDIAAASISLFGHYPDGQLAELAADLTRNRKNTSADVVRFANAATTGMLYIFEMDMGFGGSLRYTTPHAGTRYWMELTEDWCDRQDLSIVQQLQLLSASSQLGSACSLSRLQSVVLSLGDIDAAAFDEDDYGQVISSAVREVRRRGCVLPLDLAKRFVRSKRPNIPQVGIGAIEAHGNEEALRLLLHLHGEAADWFVISSLEGAIESLAAKCGIPVQRNGKSLSILECT
ncbi:NACHT domain-containing protein [Rhodocyclus tenuis]|uniref:NACHT domain-containing protein n=1 Tax=Rhodocyclus tenuis TaxID=1066 RepID=UPI001904A23B|nr:NACHT domain-containing protein [Rhodocyclus tenuis]